ncbi:MAG: spore gernimation protein GerC [Oscillospiraceae bacterium]|nr:spore gernimation protein GerC [Oscillospiraceae bacterium]
MKRLAVCLAGCLLLSGCGGLPQAREPEDTVLMRILGVDETDHGVTLTAASAAQSDKEPVVLSVTADTAENAMVALEGAGEGYVSLVYVTQIILGADTPVETVLTRVMGEKRMGQTATVWMTASGTAQELIEQTQGSADRLTSIEQNTDVTALTVLEASAELFETKEIMLPVLAVEDKKLVAAGYSVVREGD